MTRKCYVCRRHIDKKDTFIIDPATARLAKVGVSFCIDCVPKQALIYAKNI